MEWAILLKLLKKFWREGAILLLIGTTAFVWHLYKVRGIEIQLEQTKNIQLQANVNELSSAIDGNNTRIDKMGEASKKVSEDIARQMTLFKADMKDLYDNRSTELKTDIEQRLKGMSPEEGCFALWAWLNNQSEQLDHGK